MLRFFLTTCLLLGTMLIDTTVPALQANAQEAMERTELRRTMLAGTENTEVVMARLVIQPGAFLPRHTHPGDEFVYVLDGGMIQPEGQDPTTFETGASLHFPRDVVHGGFTVVGDKAITVLTTHIVDAGVPMVIPAE